jgi:hypothetical protein
MNRGKSIRSGYPRNWIFPLMACLVIPLVLFVTSCGKKEEKGPQKQVVRPVKIMTVVSGEEAFKRKFPGRLSGGFDRQTGGHTYRPILSDTILGDI